METTETLRAAPLQRFDEGSGNRPVAGEDHVMLHDTGQFERIDGELDVHVALDLTPAGGVGEFLRRLP